MWGPVSKSFPDIVEEELNEEEEGGQSEGSVEDSARSVRGGGTSDRLLDKWDSVIDKKVELLEKQMEGQRGRPEFLGLEEKLKTSYKDIFKNELEPGKQ